MSEVTLSESQKTALLQSARAASTSAYAPFSKFHVGAALLFDDGAVLSASNVENASYGLSLCAETVAVAKAFNDGRRGGLVAVAVCGPADHAISPCGRCRQVLAEMAGLGATDPLVLCQSAEGGAAREFALSRLLPEAFSMD